MIENIKINPQKKIINRITFTAVFSSLAIALSLLENLIPISLLIPIPGIKIGLANIITLLAIVILSPLETIAIIVIRCVTIGLFTGPIAFLFSITGAILSWVVMVFLSYGVGKVFSVIGLSIGGACSHSIGQIIISVILLKDWGIVYYYLPFLLLISIVSGAITGFASIGVIKYVKKVI